VIYLLCLDKGEFDSFPVSQQFSAGGDLFRHAIRSPTPEKFLFFSVRSFLTSLAAAPQAAQDRRRIWLRYRYILFPAMPHLLVIQPRCGFNTGRDSECRHRNRPRSRRSERELHQ